MRALKVFFTVSLMMGASLSAALAQEASTAQPTTQLVPKEVAFDTNKDGKPDRWEHYHADGKLDKVQVDTNGDGKVDEIGYAEDGKLVRSEKDSDFDGSMDQWAKY